MPDETSESTDAGKKELTAEEEAQKAEEVHSATEVVLALGKAAKAIKMYLPNNPLHQKFLQELFQKTEAHLRAYGQLRLGVKQDQLLCREEVVYENPNRTESLALRMYVDGIREMVFQQGLAQEEVHGFLKIICGESQSRQPDENIVTLLWEENYPHISYLVVEEYLGSGMSLPERTQEKRDLPALVVKALAHKVEEPVSLVLPTPQEMERLAKEIVAAEEEEEKDPYITLLHLLFALLPLEKEEEVFSQFMESLDKVLEGFLTRGDFEHAALTLQWIREFSSAPSFTEGQKERMTQSLLRAGDQERVKRVETVLSRGGHIHVEALSEYLIFLDRSALPHLCDLLGSVTEKSLRVVVCEALVVLGKEDVETLVKRLKDERWFVVRNIVYVLGKIGGIKAVEGLSRVVTYAEPRVRREVIHALEGAPEPKAKDTLVSFLDDPDSTLRVQALRALTNAHHHRAADHLMKRISQKEFGEKPFTEKKEFFDTLAAVAADEAVPFLSGILRQAGKWWFGKEKDDEQGICASLALRRIGSARALSALEGGSLLRRRAVRDACRKALDEIAQKASRS